MKNKKINKKVNILAITILIIIFIIAFVIINKKQNKRKNSSVNSIEKINTENVVEEKPINNTFINETELPQETKNEINNLKQNVGITGDTSLYDIQDEDGRKVIAVKSSMKYKTAFAGMIKSTKPETSEVDKIVGENHPNKAGIWIESKYQKKVLELIKNITNSEYNIDDNGYLKINKKNNQNEYDKILEDKINGNKLYIIAISSTCYIIDNIDGNIVDYNFEKMDKYQTYEYFEDEDKIIIFISENSNNVLNKKDIISSVINLIKQ